jgi:hypothetical protein
MERAPVISTDIRAIGYDPDSQILEVEFNSGGVYQYSGVSPYEHEGIMNADSKGKYFHSNIKNRYPFSKL